uniref:Uncharacterized protein n=1 Tax=Ditylenchus dipsaci TaxID=166011 RepID=A0A915CW58_9BILA
MNFQFVYLLCVCIILCTFESSHGEKEANIDENEHLSRADRLGQIAALQDKVDCLKEGSANAAGTVEQARVAKEKVTQAKLRMRIAEAKAILAKAAEHIDNIKASCKKDAPATASTA